MAATDAPIRKTPKAKPVVGETPLVADQNARMRANVDEAAEALNKQTADAAADADAMDALAPGAGDSTSWLDKPVDDLKEIRRWVIGKPPADGGKESEYSVYVSSRLAGWLARASSPSCQPPCQRRSAPQAARSRAWATSSVRAA